MHQLPLSECQGLDRVLLLRNTKNCILVVDFSSRLIGCVILFLMVCATFNSIYISNTLRRCRNNGANLHLLNTWYNAEIIIHFLLSSTVYSNWQYAWKFVEYFICDRLYTVLRYSLWLTNIVRQLLKTEKYQVLLDNLEYILSIYMWDIVYIS